MAIMSIFPRPGSSIDQNIRGKFWKFEKCGAKNVPSMDMYTSVRRSRSAPFNGDWELPSVPGMARSIFSTVKQSKDIMVILLYKVNKVN